MCNWQILRIIFVNSAQIQCAFSNCSPPFKNYQWHCCTTLFAKLVYLLSLTKFVVLYCVHFYVYFYFLVLFSVASSINFVLSGNLTYTISLHIVAQRANRHIMAFHGWSSTPGAVKCSVIATDV